MYLACLDGNTVLLPEIIDRHHAIAWLLRGLPFSVLVSRYRVL